MRHSMLDFLTLPKLNRPPPPRPHTHTSYSKFFSYHIKKQASNLGKIKAMLLSFSGHQGQYIQGIKASLKIYSVAILEFQIMFELP
jgi:hypothetical protein